MFPNPFNKTNLRLAQRQNAAASIDNIASNFQSNEQLFQGPKNLIWPSSLGQSGTHTHTPLDNSYKEKTINQFAQVPSSEFNRSIPELRVNNCPPDSHSIPQAPPTTVLRPVQPFQISQSRQSSSAQLKNQQKRISFLNIPESAQSLYKDLPVLRSTNLAPQQPNSETSLH